MDFLTRLFSGVRGAPLFGAGGAPDSLSSSDGAAGGAAPTFVYFIASLASPLLFSSVNIIDKVAVSMEQEGASKMKRDDWGRVLGVCAAVAMMGTGVRAQDAEGEAQETTKTTAQRLADGTLDSVVWEIEGTAPAETVAAGEHAVVPCSVEDADYAMSVGNGTLVWTDDPAPRFAYADALAVEPAVAFTRSLACRAVASDADAAGLQLPRAVEKLCFTNDFTLECYLRVDAGSPQWSRLLEVKRANTLTQNLDAPEQSFTLLLQQATEAPAGGTASLQMRFDVQINYAKGNLFSFEGAFKKHPLRRS